MCSRWRDPDTRAVSEMLGVAVLVGMTLLVTVGLGLSVLVIADDDQAQTAEISFTHFSDSLLITYEDERERPAGELFIDGPQNNVTWAEMDDDLEPEDPVGMDSNIRVDADSPYGSGVAEDDVFDIVFYEDGERFVLASWNRDDEEEGPDGPTVGPDDPVDPDGSDI